MNIEINNNMNVNTDGQNINLDYDNDSSQMSMEDGKPSVTIPQTTITVESGVGSVSTGGTTDHAKLKNLDYESSGHTGFQKAGDYALKSDIPDTSDFIKDSKYVHTDNNFTDEDKSKLDGIEDNANNYVLPNDVVQDENYIHTDNNYTSSEKSKLSSIEANANNYVLPNDVVQDAEYVHTDNNFTDADKEKLDNLKNPSGKAIDISYEDNYGYGGENVQDALDKAFDTLDDKMSYRDFRDDYDQTIGDINDLETEDTTNLVNAINSLVGQSGGSGGIPELSGDINIYDLEQGIYILKGADTRLLRNSYAFMSKPVLNDYSKSILIFIREAEFGEQGFLLKASTAGPYVQLYAFDRTTLKEYNAMQLMSMNNTTSYSVTNTYQPAHKQYVDGQINKLRGEIGGITELGEIDMQEWDDDMDSFMGSLIDTGRYHFIDSWDNFDWYLEVISIGNRVGQWYWYTEEGYNVQYYRDGWLNDEDIYEWSDWQSDVTWETLQYHLEGLESNISNSYAPKSHVHYVGVSLTASMSLMDWLDSRRIKGYNQYIITTLSDQGMYFVTLNYDALNKGLNYVYYQEYYDLVDPSKIYKRIGTAPSSSNNATVTWQPWYVFEGTQV